MPTSIERLNVDLRTMPLKAAFVTAKGRSESARALVIELTLSDGTTAYGASSPAQYVTKEDFPDAEASIRAMADTVRGADVMEYDALFSRLRERHPAAYAARAGVEIAVMDAFGKLTGQSL